MTTPTQQQVTRAGELGSQHGNDGITPYGDLNDAADLMTELGETGWTTAANDAHRHRLLTAYQSSWAYAAGRDYGNPPAPPGVLTPRLFAEALTRAGLDVSLETLGGPGSWPLPTGTLPDGRNWILGDAGDHGFVGPEAPLPARLHLQFYRQDDKPDEIIADCTAAEAEQAIRKATGTGEVTT